MAGVVRAEHGTVAIVRVTGITGRRFATSKPAFETAEVFLDLVERPLVLFLQLLNIVPQFPDGIDIWVHGSSYTRCAREPMVGKTLPICPDRTRFVFSL